ncbi:MAG: phosphoribosylglycinamide formyltransferase [Deltaproteobacteria bacterium]|nr:phosphoribosylglycinamide formyltransferase [Deltaproteobacteria bacterium]MCB9786112.1 phosphoribosylglycinamide formyltransferase [Deltaproteobacteria bacterium]
MTRFAVLISGKGSNLRAILDFWANPPIAYPAHLSAPVLVVSNRPGVPGLAVAEAAGVPAQVVDHTAFSSRAAFEEALDATLRRHEVQWLVLAGFMRLLSPEFVRRWAGRMLNTHPALLPAFPGPRGPADAVAAGVKVSGCTVHFVDEGMDTGAIIAQAAVPVLDTDTAESLGSRIRRVEHRIYPKVVAKVLAGQFRVEGRVVHLEGGGP